jgi:hypothetical protein
MARPNILGTTEGVQAETSEGQETTRRERTLRVSIAPNENRTVGHREFQQLCEENPEELWDLVARIQDERDEIINNLEVQLAEEQLGNQELGGAHAREILKITAERDSYAVQIARMTMRTDERAGTTITENRKSSKIPDPEELSDGKDLKFDTWHMLMQQKLEANADHYTTTEARKAYVTSRTKGKALEHIMSRTKVAGGYLDENEIFTHLKGIYGDPNRVINAQHKFRMLYMKPADRFQDFLSEFIFLATEAEAVESTWKDELYRRLTTKLQELLIQESIRDSEFRVFTECCSQTANRLEIINYRNNRNRGAARGRFGNIATNTGNRQTTPGTRSSPAPKEITANSPRTKEETPAPGRYTSLASEGKCFGCGETGHMKRDCPKKPNHQLHVLEEVKDDESGKEKA